MEKTYNNLIGKKVRFCICEATGRRAKYYGTRQGEVVSVDAGVRKGFRSVRVRMGGQFTSPNGVLSYLEPVHIKVLRKELSMLNHPTGILEGSDMIPLTAWLVKNGIEKL